MPIPNLFILYVSDPLSSAPFYETLFGRAPTAAFPTYVAFSFGNGMTVALWSASARDFVSSGTGHRSELCFMVAAADEVAALQERWERAGVVIEQPLHEAVFGPTFVALDPDGHRIRVCMPDK